MCNVCNVGLPQAIGDVIPVSVSVLVSVQLRPIVSSMGYRAPARYRSNPTECIMSTKELVVQMATAFFPSGPHFRGQFTPLILLKFPRSNSPDFYLSNYVKMSKWPKSA